MLSAFNCVSISINSGVLTIMSSCCFGTVFSCVACNLSLFELSKMTVKSLTKVVR